MIGATYGAGFDGVKRRHAFSLSSPWTIWRILYPPSVVPARSESPFVVIDSDLPSLSLMLISENFFVAEKKKLLLVYRKLIRCNIMTKLCKKT